MRKILVLAITVLIFTISGFAAEVTLLKRTIQITPQKYLRFWKNPKAAEPVYNTNSWYPNVRFEVLGPIESGSNIYVEIDKPTGGAWLKIKMQTPKLEDDEWEALKPEAINRDDEEKMAIIDSGIFPFRIRIKNALAGSDKILFSGKFKVNLLTLDQSIPENKGKKEFMVDYDWHLPLAYLWLNPVSDENVPYLSAQFCFKGELRGANTEGYLYYNGKQIAKSTTNPTTTELTSGSNEPHHRYTILQYDFAMIRGFNKSGTSNYPQAYFLDKNPGTYEIKILRSNQIARTLTFTVGADGKIVDTMFAKNANLGGVRIIFPAKITGNSDGQFNAAAWQTETLFSNPLQGFLVQQ